MVDEEALVKDILASINTRMLTLPLTAKLSQSQYLAIRDAFTIRGHKVMHYSSIQRYWRNQKGLPPSCDPEEFFALVREGTRVLQSRVNGQTVITLSNKLFWMMYLAHPSLQESLPAELPMEGATLQVDFLLWYDGAKLWGSRKGLFCALKLVDASLIVSGRRIEIDRSLYRLLITRAWVLSVRRTGETKGSIAELEKEVLQQYALIGKAGPARIGSIVLQPKLLGVTADHGAHSKSVGSNSSLARCGECTAILSNDVPYAFLDWVILCKTRPISVREWNHSRFDDMPSHLEGWAADGEDQNFVSYDNHHNVVGHVQNLFKLLDSLIPSGFRLILKARMYKLTRVTSETQPRGSSLEDWKFYRGFQWRLVSLHLSDLFADAWSTPGTRSAFETLFSLLTEIHLFNYIHWDRQSDHFNTIRLRYCLVLFMYTMQIRACFTAEEASQLNTMYLHKILLHSVWIFRRINLAACSCEQGESLISTVNGILPYTGGSTDQRMRKLILHLTLLEEQQLKAMKTTSWTKSVVFQDFFANYSSKDISLRLKKYDYDGLSELLRMEGFQNSDLAVQRVRSPIRYHIVHNSAAKFLAMITGSLSVRSRPSIAHSSTQHSQWQLEQRRLPVKKFNSFNDSPGAIRVRGPVRERISALQQSAEEQLKNLATGPLSCARSLMLPLREMMATPVPSKWSESDEDDSCAAALSLIMNEKQTWESAFQCGSKAKPATIEKKKRIKGKVHNSASTRYTDSVLDQYGEEVLSIAWIAEVLEFFTEAISFYSKLSGSILLYFDTSLVLSSDDTQRASLISHNGVRLRELLAKWQRSLKELAQTYYSVCHNLELLEKEVMVFPVPNPAAEIPVPNPGIETEGQESMSDSASSEGESEDCESALEEDSQETESTSDEGTDESGPDDIPFFVRQDPSSSRPRRSINTPARLTDFHH